MVKYPPLRYYGGKWKMADWIISYFPKHSTYIEVCGGAAGILLKKQPSELEIYNDLNKDVVNFFRVLRERPNELIEKLQLTPYARDEFEYCWERCEDIVEWARRFFVCCWMGMSGQPFERHTGFRTTSFAEQNFTIMPKNFTNSVDNLYLVANRLRLVQIENRDATYIIERYDHKNSLFYFDPPYLKDTRIAKNNYLNDCDNTLHIEAAKLLNNIKGVAIVSGYNHPLYDELYQGWKKVEKEVYTNGNTKSGAKKATECLWLHPRIKTELTLF